MDGSEDAKTRKGQHLEWPPGEGLLGNPGASTVRGALQSASIPASPSGALPQPGPSQPAAEPAGPAKPRPAYGARASAAPRAELRSFLKTEFPEIAAPIRPDVDLRDSEAPAESLGHIKGETKNIDARGMLLTLRLPSLDWLVVMLTQRVLLKVSMTLPRLGSSISTVARVAWAEAFSDPERGCRLGILFDKLSVIERDRLIRFAASQKAIRNRL